MGVIRNIIAAVLAISILTFVALFGQLPALRKTPIGWLNRLLRHRIPNALAELDRHVTGGRTTVTAKRLGNYLFYKKNPVVLIIFLGLLTGAAVLFLWHAVPHLPANLIIPIPFLLVQPYIFTWLCAAYTGHHITPAAHRQRLHDYPYDHVLFRPDFTCSTCNLAKPARSKHCSLCGVCIAMCDHHCPWINNCVGRGNYRYFLALLLALGLVESYGTYLSWYLLRPYLKTDPTNAWLSWAHFDEVVRAAVVAINVGGLSIAGVGMLMAATVALPFGLLAYHCYLIWAGMTTNESAKWGDWREDMWDGLVFKASRKALQAHERSRKQSSRDSHHANRVSHPLYLRSSFQDEPRVPWPKSSDQAILFSEDGRPPLEEEALWERIWSLKDVENIYDLGGWHNFKALVRGR